MIQKINSILLVDDDPDDQLLFQEALSDADNSIRYTSASDGIHALELLNAEGAVLPELIFMDVNMPRMNGLDCLKEIQKSTKLKHIHVIMYSTSCSVEYQKECFANGAVDYIEKPNDFKTLCTRIDGVIRQGILPAVNTIPPVL